MPGPMRDHVRFLLGDELREIRDVDPTMTVLDWLRTVERRVGTKEGCAEGDCGACTVVVGRLDGGRLRHEAVNACIRFLPTLDGCQLLTVEHLKAEDGRLHPVQQALVDRHGSQCGFCTPGFVMSLFALYQNEERPTPERIDDALAGNLCRCTGYAPIAAAAERMYELGAPADDRFSVRRNEVARRLAALADEATVAVGRDGRRFFAPASADALAALCLEHPDACIVAGATDVGLWVTKHQRVLPTVIYTGRVRDLRTIVDTGEALSIGAAVTYADAAAPLARLYPDVGELVRRIGAEQVRNMGTVGGNIANGSPIGDGPPALIAAGARLVLRRGDERRTLPLEDFFIAYGRQDRRPGEFVERIIVPKPNPADRFRAYKISKRFDQDISAVCGAFRLRVENGRVADVRLAYGGMAGTPKRASEAEKALLGQPWTEASVHAAMAALARDFTPLTDWRASAGYRQRVAANLLMKLYVETTEPSAETRLVGDRSLAHA
ncbi:xanthine dehydrogenase small subunit [Chelatococcus sp. SYSU_G07232]|uniref:Xanthine dehydrogenase small subunit n=1 Tax=Chelatococcus albus TaxID=3047466 RepID=A0ABT7ACH3_9HYPH|nr:xanthine dehydrogenase small subunit [Chelatococcus sp. SYSU_G07232]MDJ1157054.1 xanthine dehydrogenase small subunit [Chelatococcus sp. SYSU_G07232]